MSNVAGTSSSESAASLPSLPFSSDSSSARASSRKVGVFWDIQNCAVTHSIQAANVVQNVRELYAELGVVEAEFAVVCDPSEELKPVMLKLYNLQVDIFHVPSHAKNACDLKIEQLINRFVKASSENSVVVLISSDINFAPICSDLKYRQNIHVILVHSNLVSPCLTAAANECRSFEIFRDGNKLDLNDKKLSDSDDEAVVTVSNWPAEFSPSKILDELTRYTESTGGRVIPVGGLRSGMVYFRSLTDAQRFVQRIQNKRVRDTTLTAKILQHCEPEVVKKTEEKEKAVKTDNFECKPVEIIDDHLSENVGGEERNQAVETDKPSIQNVDEKQGQKRPAEVFRKENLDAAIAKLRAVIHPDRIAWQKLFTDMYGPKTPEGIAEFERRIYKDHPLYMDHPINKPNNDS